MYTLEKLITDKYLYRLGSMDVDSCWELEVRTKLSHAAPSSPYFHVFFNTCHLQFNKFLYFAFK